MTIHDIRNTEHTVGELVEETDPIAATIRLQMQAEKDRADEYAKSASFHRMEAERLETLAMERRALQRRWAMQLTLAASENGDPANDQGDIQTALVARPRTGVPYPLAHTPGAPDGRRCNGCLHVIRDATPEEVAATAAGRELPDARRDCPECGIEAAARRMPYPHAGPPDAA